MLLRFYSPIAALRPYIQTYMIMHVRIGEQNETLVKPFPPGPEQCLYFYARDGVNSYKPHNPKAVMSSPHIVVGPQVSRVNLVLHPNHLTVAVLFQPGGLYTFLGGMPMTELFDFSIDSALLWPIEIRELNEQLATTDNYELMVALVEGFLVRQYARNHPKPEPIDKIFPLMLNPLQAPSLDVLASLACVSSRQFRRKFYERIGMSPKIFARIIRFSKAFRLKENNPHLDWLDVVCITGYHDFQHLLRDFKEFANTTPTLLSADEQSSDLKIYTSVELNLLK